jgi:hypothetical protein
LRKLMAALWLGGVLTVPAVATDWKNELDAVAREAAPAAPTEWREGDWLAGTGPGVADPIRAFEHRGPGWVTLDGWMRGDPTLRSWVLLRFDADGDEALSTSEAAMARRTFYTLADTNRSGIITSEEFLNGWGTVRVALLGPYAFAG